MTSDDFLKLLEKADSIANARSVVRKHGVPELAEALFNQWRIESGRDYDEALRLAEIGAAFIQVDGCEPAGYRFKALHLKLQGKWLASANAFQEARKVAQSEAEGAKFALGGIDSFARAGRKRSAIALGSELFAIAVREGDKVTAGKIALNTGNAHAWFDELAEAEGWYERATSHLSQEEAPIERAMALTGLSTALLGRKPADFVRPVAEEAYVGFLSLGLTDYAATAQSNIAAAERLDGHYDLALKTLLEVRNSFSSDEEEAFRVEHDLGGVYLAMNMWSEAEDAYQSALRKQWAKNMLVHRAGCWQGIAICRFWQGKNESAKVALKRAEQDYRKYGDDVWIADVITTRYTFSVRKLSRKQLDELIQAGETLRLHGQSRMLFANLIVQAKNGVRSAIKNLKQLAKNPALFDLVWEMYYVQALQSEGKQRDRYFSQMAEEIWRGRMAVQSNLSVAGYLRNKAEAIQTWLESLLASQTPERIAQVREIIIRSRSIALVDEILNQPSPLDGDLRVRLTELRSEIQRRTSNQEGQRSQRLEAASASVQRMWRELTFEVGDRLWHQYDAKNDPGEWIYLEVKDDLYLIRDNQATKLEISASELDQKLRWLHFELVEPSLGFQSDGKQCQELLNELQIKLQFDPTICKRLSPEGVFWSVPWQAMARDDSVQISLTPGRSELKSKPISQKRVVIWYHEAEDLPHVHQEVATLISFYPMAEVCTTISEARDSLEGGCIDILHIAAHGIFQPSNPMLSSINLSDGQIQAAELVRSKARIGHVTMAACFSGAMSSINRYEPDGLSRGFLACGAERVLAGQWAIDDRSSVDWSEAFYGSLSAGRDVMSCLNVAREALQQKYEHPYFWASVVCFNGYSKQGTSLK
ncbi:MAG: CHAT domain-containing protein [Armatimonadetes bacterium]|nr:CHAT domain-containing protein [Armatimonadota bacterium]